ncbi:hypothetical protein M153_7300014934 [Pseudoloma neurophilia]|uniref:Uncharacterized protein n=1 Tax=Pseudoloma neurophilia TaxID=146866 RepID=A0A0R0M0P4_9MICR|nr:hypothetical protein M153_7300014934 [Pseudoloma neurophilia]
MKFYREMLIQVYMIIFNMFEVIEAYSHKNHKFGFISRSKNF